MKRTVATLLLLGAAATACNKQSPPVMHATSGNSPVPAATELDPAVVVATIDGHAITAKEVDDAASSQLGHLRQKLLSETFELRKQALDDLLVTQLIDSEAKKEGITEDAWLKLHVDGPAPAATAADAKTFYDQNAARMEGRSFEQEKLHIIAFLTNQKRREAATKVFDDLKSKARIEVLLEEPPVNVAASGPSLGPENAPVTVVEFSDFQCPFCSKVEPTIKRLMTDYAGKVRFVFRDYPLPFHDHAQKASEASHCAEAQDKYWPMHDALFANQDKLDVDGLKKLAAALTGMDQAKFDRCLDSGEMKGTVAENQRAGEAVGVEGTPHFFVNGRSLDGAQPYDSFKKAIDHALSKIAPPK